MGVFFPFVRNHSIKGSVDQEPWAFDEEVLNVCRTAIERRYILMPYIYTLFREASINGMPVMRPLFMADPTDLNLRSEERSFLLGGDLMVIPRWAENTALPQGEWQETELQAQARNQQKDNYQAILRQRPGSIIPLANLAQSTNEMRTDSLTLLVCLDEEGKACGQLYEDDGDGFSYRSGNYRLTTISAQLEKKQLSVSMKQTEGLMAAPQRTLRVAYMKKGRLHYSNWQSENHATIKIK